MVQETKEEERREHKTKEELKIKTNRECVNKSDGECKIDWENKREERNGKGDEELRRNSRKCRQNMEEYEDVEMKGR